MIPLKMDSFSPHVTQQDWSRLQDMVNNNQAAQCRIFILKRHHLEKLQKARKRLQLMMLSLRTVAELNRHRRSGHREFSKDCPECVKAMGSTRPHFSQIRPDGGELSVDITGPFAEALAPPDRPVTTTDKLQYILVAV